MALSFFYLAFVRVLQLLRLSRHENRELAIEVVMLRHEVARPTLRPAERARPVRFFVRDRDVKFTSS
jgi:hypothetical protein